jgi:hypothetical protein
MLVEPVWRKILHFTTMETGVLGAFDYLSSKFGVLPGWAFGGHHLFGILRKACISSTVYISMPCSSQGDFFFQAQNNRTHTSHL